MTRGPLMGGKGRPAGIATFSEPAIQGGYAALNKMRDKSGEVVGFGAQLEVWTPGPSGKPNPDFPTTWTLVLPGRGTLFLYEIENPARLFARLAEAQAGPLPWRGSINERTTIGPGPDGVGLIVGGTGEFEGRRGTFVETNQFTAIEPGKPQVEGALAATGGAVGSTTLTITYSN